MTLWRPIFALLALGGACAAMGQDVSDYLRLRKQLGIHKPVSVETLESATGSHAFEIQGHVKGTFKVRDRMSILLERPDGRSEMIESDHVPAWLDNSDVAARLLVRATRNEEYGSLHSSLIAAAPEESIARVDAREAARVKEASSMRNVEVRASGNGGLHGSIGRGGSYHAPSRHRTWNLPSSKATPIYAGFIKRQNPKLSDREAYRIAQAVIGFSLKYGVDPRLIMAIVMVESGFDPSSTSNHGAQGLGQLMPDTAKWMNVSNAYDSVDNLAGTVKLMRLHLVDYRTQTGDNFRSLVLALAAYNAGIGAVKRAGGVPYASTQRYVEHVIGLYRQFCGV